MNEGGAQQLVQHFLRDLFVLGTLDESVDEFFCDGFELRVRDDLSNLVEGLSSSLLDLVVLIVDDGAQGWHDLRQASVEMLGHAVRHRCQELDRAKLCSPLLVLNTVQHGRKHLLHSRTAQLSHHDLGSTLGGGLHTRLAVGEGSQQHRCRGRCVWLEETAETLGQAFQAKKSPLSDFVILGFASLLDAIHDFVLGKGLDAQSSYCGSDSHGCATAAHGRRLGSERDVQKFLQSFVGLLLVLLHNGVDDLHNLVLNRGSTLWIQQALQKPGQDVDLPSVLLVRP
mmetsp:Transcript_29929/g.63719  ORF Transcript_29929/g.63719 Transcript_29929/m.63719 type:complete len:284 (-) Transcript_29929:299-1150(-)